MQEKRRSARAAEGTCQLSSYGTGLSHPRHYETASASDDKLYGTGNRIVQPAGKPQYGLPFVLKRGNRTPHRSVFVLI